MLAHTNAKNGATTRSGYWWKAIGVTFVARIHGNLEVKNAMSLQNVAAHMDPIANSGAAFVGQGLKG